jgi:hypothetical protein
MFESLESRQMFSVTLNTSFNTQTAPSQSIGADKSIGVQGATFRQTLSAADSPAPGIIGLNSANTVMVASSAK